MADMEETIMTIYKCDRCDRTVGSAADLVQVVRLIKGVPLAGDSEVELCAVCQNTLINFLRPLPKVTATNQ